MEGTLTLVDSQMGTAQIVNNTDIETDSIMKAFQGQHPEVAALVTWTKTASGGSGRGRLGGLFERDRYVTPHSIFDQMRVAHDAAESDDVVSGIIESTESLAFSKMGFLAEDKDEEDIWNQIAADLDLDSRLREMWRELFTVSQFYALTWWGRKSYKVRGKTVKGNEKRKTFDNIYVPLGLSLLDPLKVVPVGNVLFGAEQLCYIADRTERDMLDAACNGDPEADPVARQIIMQKYAPTDLERKWLSDIGISYDFLYLLNPQNVWRHTATRAQYQRFAAVRMKSVFELLDLKQQLRSMDRAHLVGGTNFIVLIKKGSEQHPAKPAEVQMLQSQVRTIAQVPVIVGDHRLSIEIITPKQDQTLMPEKYNGLDARITARLYLMFMTGNFAAGGKNDDSIKLAKVVARGMESRRHQLRRAVERQLVRPVYAKNDALSTEPKLRFLPGRIELDFDSALVQFLIDLRDRGDMSRETLLSEIGVDQADEAVLRKREAETFDDVFTPTNVPYNPSVDAKDTKEPPTQGSAGAQVQKLGADPNAPPPELPPHSHGPTGEPVAFPPKKVAGPAKKAPAKKAAGSNKAGGRADTPAKKVKMDPRTAGRNMGGRRRGGGAAPGSGQGQAPRRGRPKNT
jgi:hypothetical protein